MFADQKRLYSRVEKWQCWQNENFNYYNGDFLCRMEVSSVEWTFGICRIAMDGPYGLP